MDSISKTISHTIANQFPAIYREEGELLVAFTEAYYEYLEQQESNSYIYNGRLALESNDIDHTVEDFIDKFKSKYLADLPFVASSDKRFIVKHIMDFYRTKGSEKSLKLLMQLLFDEEVSIYYPSSDVLRLSDSKWSRPIYIELSRGANINDLVDKQITGSVSGAKAFVEGVIRKRLNGAIIYVVYLSSVSGIFEVSESITADGNIIDAATVLGSLHQITIDNGGRNFAVGDILNVTGSFGTQGKVKVASIVEETGKVDFELVDGGYGYTLTDTTDVLVSDAVLYADTSNTASSFVEYEQVEQRIEKLTLISATDVNSASVGDALSGIDDGSSTVANGTVLNVANTDANGSVITVASANSIVTVQVTGAGTFATQSTLDFAGASVFSVDEYVDEESSVDLVISSVVGTFQVGEVVEQVIRDGVSNTIISHVSGVTTSANSTVLELDTAWGTFDTSYAISGVASSATAGVTNVTVTEQGARGIITAASNSEITVTGVYGAFTATKDIKGLKTNSIETITTVTNAGASDVWLGGVNTSNGSITEVSKEYASGMVIGSNSSAVGIYGNTVPFYSDGINTVIETKRDLLISPPKHANGDIIELSVVITELATGADATFNVGYLENTETVSLNTDLVGGTNIMGASYFDIKASGENSGMGYLDTITVDTGGTGYSNGTVVSMSAGGFAGGLPTVEAEGIITTNGSGVITSIAVSPVGEGYFSTPTVDMDLYTAGTVATVTLNMGFGYGFPKSPLGGKSANITDLMTMEDFTMGKISSLAGINPGSNYNADPFVKVRNKYISAYNKLDYIIYVENVVGSFKPGERISQTISATTTYKGTVKNFTSNYDGTGTLLVDRTMFNVGFNDAYAIAGETTGSTSEIVNVVPDHSSEPLGDNADVTGEVIAASGIANAVEVIDSGYGYLTNSSVTLESANSNYIVTGTAIANRQGISEGYWTTTTSHLNSEKKIHDNSYYQDYAYEIVSGLSLDKYGDTMKKILHLSGTELFGNVTRISYAKADINILSSSITTS